MADAELDVFLGEVLVGHLRERNHRVSFSFVNEYLEAPNRPVLGQWFEDRLREGPFRERHGGLPVFFENLLPSGSVVQLAREVGGNESHVMGVVEQTLLGLQDAWRAVQGRISMLPSHKRALVAHWQTVPLLRRLGPLAE
jgi:HipA-like protein